MVEHFLSSLAPRQRVLDLGCQAGSFDRRLTHAQVVRVDLDDIAQSDPGFVQSDAARLPFASGAFDLVVANHSLEHFDALDAALAEIGRVVRPGGALFVSVPDASTITDRVYRWLARGGGHVNPFTDPEALARRISRATGLAHTGTVTLHSGLSFLNRRNTRTPPRKLWLLGGGYEPVLRHATHLFRVLDRTLGTRLSVYGWAFYFGVAHPSGDPPQWNVCIRCGSGHSAAWLSGEGLVKRSGLWSRYECPHCGAPNLFTPDEAVK